MTKKKLRLRIIAVVIALFFCSELMIFWGCGEILLRNLNTFWSYTVSNEFIHDFYNSGYRKDTVDLHRRITFGHNPVFSTESKPAFAFAMIDRDKNIVFESESGIWWTRLIPHADDGFKYVSIEEYLTPELENEILKYQRNVNGRSAILKELELNFDGEKYTPVSFTINEYGKDNKKITLTNLPVTETVTDKNGSLYYYLHDRDKNSVDHIYYERTKAKIAEEIEEFEFTDDGGGGGGFNGTGEMCWSYQQDGYAFFYEVEYNYPLEVITSDVFGIFTFYLFVMFLVVTIFILSSATRLYNRQVKFEQSKRAFVSAAAHELKTPLAVIQNQCECIIDGINPEKNQDYVQSVYEEAVRMNGIVKSLLTFNRLSDITEIHKEKCSLSAMAEETVQKYSAFADTVTITSQIEDNVSAVCNGELIAIAMDNYLSNAVKYATGEKRINVSLTADDNRFTFKVWNDFDGEISVNEIWDIFARADKARNSNSDSTGMGLPVNKKIFELHSYRYYCIRDGSGVSFIFEGKIK